MTDAESFYLLLVVFYLAECFKFSTPHSNAVVSPLDPRKAWRPHGELARLMGVGKWVFLAPVLPWPRMLIIASKAKPAAAPNQIKIGAHAIRRLTRFWHRATAHLRRLSALVFIFYFVLLPYSYQWLKGTPIFLAIVGAGYALMALAAFLYFRIHARLLPRARGDRLKNTLFTALLPWHCMRCSDDIIIGFASKWSWPEILAAHIENPKSKATLLRLWRETQLMKNPRYTQAELLPLLEYCNIDHSVSSDETSADPERKQCPCCLAMYESHVVECADCRGVALIEPPFRPVSISD